MSLRAKALRIIAAGITLLGPLPRGVARLQRPGVTITSAAALVEALRTSAPGTRMLLKPGVYRGEFVIDRPVEIDGDGRRNRIVLESVSGTCLTLRAGDTVIRGVTVRGRAGNRGPRGVGIGISDGAPTLE